MRSSAELYYLIRDFALYVRHRDYFRQPQGLGAFFRDERCYFNDLTGKAEWTGASSNGIPLLRVPALGRDIEFPIMILLFGLGALDRYFLGGANEDLRKVRSVAEWFPSALLPAGYFNNRFSILDPTREYYSDNSGMAQGLALSFALRVIHYRLTDDSTTCHLRRAVESIAQNMLLPVDAGGTALATSDGIFLMECCRTDTNVILNGWIFGVFGLWDLQRYRRASGVRRFLETTLDTMQRVLPVFHLRNGWTRYNMEGRINSPFYHQLHCALLEALHRLTGRPEIQAYFQLSRKGDTSWHRLRYTVQKIFARLTDREYQTTASTRSKGNADASPAPNRRTAQLQRGPQDSRE